MRVFHKGEGRRAPGVQRTVYVCLPVLVLTILNLSAQTVDWKRFFTLDPHEGTEFAIDTTTIVLGGGVPRLHILQDERIVLGFSGLPSYAALEVLNNGRSFVPLNQVSIRGDGGYVYLPDGRIRYVSEVPLPTNTQQRHKSQILSWISSDGLQWQKEAGIRYQPGDDDDSISSVPSVIQLKDSLWRMYYVGDFYRSNGTRTALSTDWGLTWTKESQGNILRLDDVDPQPVYLSDGRFRLYIRASMRSSKSGGIAYVESVDGLTFDTSAIHLLIPDTTWGIYLKLDPSVIKFDNGEVVCYYGAAPKAGTGATARLVRAVKPKLSSYESGDDSKHLEFEQLQLQPQPASDLMHVRWSATQSIRRIELFDELGRVVYRSHPSTELAELTLSTASLPSASYVLVLSRDTTPLCKHISIVH